MIKNKKKALFSVTMLACSLAIAPFRAQEPVEDLTEAVTEGAQDLYEADVDWDVFFTENPEEYVTLGEYSGLDVEKTIYTVSDEDVEIEVDNVLYDHSFMQDTGAPAQSGDTVTADITSTVDGETRTDEDYPVDLGYELFGPDFDARLEGCNIGDNLTFSLTFDEGFEVEEWAGRTVDFEVAVKSIQTLVQPDLTDEWVKENSEYEDIDSYKESLRERLQEEANLQYEEAAATAAFQAAMDNATFSSYPQELYDAVYAQVYSQFEMLADMFGITVDELFESYEMSDADLQDETAEQVNSYLFMSAVAKAENIEVTDEDLREFAEVSAASYGFDDADAMLSQSDPGELKLAALNRKVSFFILGLSNVTEKEYDVSEDELIFDDSSAVDDWDDDYDYDYDDEEYYDDEDYEYSDGEYDEYDDYDEYDESYDE